MKTFIVFALVVAAAVAAPPLLSESNDAVILRFVNDNIGTGEYNFAFDTSDGKSAQESGVLKNAGTENQAIEVSGQYSYPGPGGITYTVTYVANEKGFQPSSLLVKA